jgi:hypothetical protein
LREVQVVQQHDLEKILSSKLESLPMQKQYKGRPSLASTVTKNLSVHSIDSQSDEEKDCNPDSVPPSKQRRISFGAKSIYSVSSW